MASRLRLIVITDARLASHGRVEGVVDLALDAGTPAIQLRDKEASTGALLPLALRIRQLTRQAGALFFVNDRVDLALAAEADGVHLGPDDLPVAAVRRVVPEGFLIGYSTDDPEEARRAVRDGADYLGAGAVFSTASKADAGRAIGPEGITLVARSVAVPVVGIGGITPANVKLLSRTGAAGVAVIGAVMGAADPARAVRALLQAFAP
ncbi:MAG: thiamine phosphate synthase [Gemmatimonadetes bacterium]|nr:thiamine phosphate synthase [Gemmatimonadota bacterium]